MAIDVNACIGCNACVVGCQAENNIPVVGKDQVLRGREMHWLRVDTLLSRAERSNPETYFQPVPCMQCENAPCEVGLPGRRDRAQPRRAERHGLQPLRRHALLLEQLPATRSAASTSCSIRTGTRRASSSARNPDVTVRSRGVMEKCTYCVQRINAAKIDSEKEDRAVRDGEIKTGVPAGVPGRRDRLRQPERSRRAASRRLQAEVRNYSLLGELNTRPRTTYLAAVRNVNPELGA